MMTTCAYVWPQMGFRVNEYVKKIWTNALTEYLKLTFVQNLVALVLRL